MNLRNHILAVIGVGAFIIVFYYFTTAGYMTTGTMTLENGKFINHETVSGEAGGVTEVKATTQLRPDGALHMKAQYFKNGQWVDGHEFLYREDPKAEVRFRQRLPANFTPIQSWLGVCPSHHTTPGRFP